MKFSNQFAEFIDDGTRPQTHQGLTALLDEFRAAFLDLARRVEIGEISNITNMSARLADGSTYTVPETIHRLANLQRAAQGRPPIQIAGKIIPDLAPKPVPLKPAAPVIPQRGCVATKPRAEFTALKPADQLAFVKSGGKLI